MTYNAIMDYTWRILGKTLGHPGTWNDKTLILFDPLIYKVRNGYVPDDFTLKLLEKNINGDVVEIPHRVV